MADLFEEVERLDAAVVLELVRMDQEGLFAVVLVCGPGGER